MKFSPHQRVHFKSALSERVFRGFVIRPLKDGFYLVDDGTDRCPRAIHESRLQVPGIKTSGVFA